MLTKMHIRHRYGIIRTQYEDNDEIDRLLFQVSILARSSQLMEQWRIKWYGITGDGKSSSIYRWRKGANKKKKKSKKGSTNHEREKIAETLCVLFLFDGILCAMFSYIVNSCSCYLAWKRIPSTRCLTFRLCDVSNQSSLTSQMNCHAINVKSIDFQKIPLHARVCVFFSYTFWNFRTPVISVNYKWNAWIDENQICLFVLRATLIKFALQHQNHQQYHE